MSTKLYVKNPNNVQKSIDVDKIFLTDGSKPITGSIVCSSQSLLAKRNSANSYLELYGGDSYSGGAVLELWGSNIASPSYYSGRFDLTASDGVQTKHLTGYPDGALTWGGNNIVYSGGHITDTIFVDNSVAFVRSSDDSYMSLFGGRSNNGWAGGAHLSLMGKDAPSSAGYFNLQALDDNNSIYLTGTPDGHLYWDSKEVERVVSRGSRSIRYNSGLQICCDTGTTGNDGYHTFTYEKPFSAPPIVVVSPYTADNTTLYDLRILSQRSNSNGFVVKVMNGETKNPIVLTTSYIAFGWWK